MVHSEAVPHIIKIVRRARPTARLRSDGVSFWIEAEGETLGKRKSTTDRAWRSAYEFIVAS